MQPTPQYFGAVIISLLFASWTISGITSSVIRPTISSDAEAYAELCIAAKSGSYSAIESQASKAHSKASDPDILKFSDFLMRFSSFAQRAGVSTTKEAGSFVGFGKSFIAGFLNPLHGLDGFVLSIDVLLGDYNAIGTRLEDKYSRVFRRYEFSETCGTVIWWICLIGGGWAYIGNRSRIEPSLLAAVAPINFFGLKDPVDIQNTIGSDAPKPKRKRRDLNLKQRQTPTGSIVNNSH